MYQIVEGETNNLPDVSEFIDTLNALQTSRVPEARDLFEPDGELTVARAPGRLDVMGGIADYSGSLVLQLPIREATLIALQRDASRRLKIVSLSEQAGREAAFEMPLSDLEGSGGPIRYDLARNRFHSEGARDWAAYVAGVFLVLMHERGVDFRDGSRILIASRVPEGKGVSSSAALEVAVLQAIAAEFKIAIKPRDLALLGQIAENCVVGAPCGVMDQMTAACGEADRLLALICQPAELIGMISIPEQIAFWGLDSGIRHAVVGADYGSVRVGTFMGYRIIAELAGLHASEATPGGRANVVDPRWNGYLANLSPSEYAQFYGRYIPDRLEGGEFLARYGPTTDTVTQVDPGRTYAVRAPTEHAIFEHHRVRLFAELLAGSDIGEQRLSLLGELMYQSHASYSACGLGSSRTDSLVELVRQAGPRHGLYGAKITGGGSGGTVAVMGRREAADAVAKVADEYSNATGYRPYLFSGSSPGSAAFGHIRLRDTQ
jgi:galactokinase